MIKIRTVLTVVATLAVLTACGIRPSDRVLSGAGIGAGAGALGSAAVGGNVVGGAVIGGVAGAAIGGLTSPRHVNLGRPIWRKNQPHIKRRHYYKRPYVEQPSAAPRNEFRYD